MAFRAVFDLRNTPLFARGNWQDLAVMSARVPEPRTTANGANAVAFLQPFASTWKGEPVRAWTIDRALWFLGRHDSVMKRDDGEELSIDFGDTRAHVLNLESRHIAVTLAREVRDVLTSVGFRSVLFDYATADLSWEAQLAGVSRERWARWRFGWLTFRALVGRGMFVLNQYNRWSDDVAWLGDGLVFEKVGHSLNPYTLVETEAAKGGRHIFISERSVNGAEPHRAFCQRMAELHRGWVGERPTIG